MVTPAQLRAARALIAITRDELGRRSGLSAQTIRRMEGAGAGGSLPGNIQAVQNALEAAGVEFISENGGGAGVRFEQSQ